MVKKYGYVNNGKVEMTGQLPVSWKNVSNLNLLSNKELEVHNWYPVIEVQPTLKDWQSINSVDYVFDSVKKVINAKYNILDLTLAQYKEQKYRTLATNTKNYVMSITPEYKQLTALATLIDPTNASYTVIEAQKIRDFAKKHTDEVRRIKDIIFNATTKNDIESQPNIVEYKF